MDVEITHLDDRTIEADEWHGYCQACGKVVPHGMRLCTACTTRLDVEERATLEAERAAETPEQRRERNFAYRVRRGLDRSFPEGWPPQVLADYRARFDPDYGIDDGLEEAAVIA